MNSEILPRSSLGPVFTGGVGRPLWVLVLLAACGGAAATEGAGPVTAADLYPLHEGAVWSFDVDIGDDHEPALAISRVLSRAGNTYEVRNDGGESVTYEVREDGIYRPASQAYLIHGPITEGRTWDAGSGRTARIAATGQRIPTPAGTFDRCVRIEESGGADGRQIATTYCPGVGVVILEAGMTSELSGMRAEVRAVLRAYSLGDDPLE